MATDVYHLRDVLLELERVDEALRRARKSTRCFMVTVFEQDIIFDTQDIVAFLRIQRKRLADEIKGNMNGLLKEPL